MTDRDDWSGHAVLLVPVPELDDWVRARTAHYDASFVSAESGFPHAHVTILAPFPATALDAVDRIARVVQPFEFAMTDLAVFPDGVIHLLPTPESGFRTLMAAARAEFSDIRPYWGRHPDPVPHLTVDRLGPRVSLASTRTLLAGAIPATCRAERLALTWWQSGACRTLRSVPLGLRTQNSPPPVVQGTGCGEAGSAADH